MPIDIQIIDDDLKGFSAPARERLGDAIRVYASALIDEANRIEAGRNSTESNPEVTRAMVNDAADLLRRGLGVPKRRLSWRILRIASATLSLVAGSMYDVTRLQDPFYLLAFILIVCCAVITVTLSVMKE